MNQSYVGEEYIEGWLQKSFEESNVVIVDPCPTLTVSLFCFIVAVQQTSVWQENCGKNNEISQYKHINQPKKWIFNSKFSKNDNLFPSPIKDKLQNNRACKTTGV